MAFGSGREHSSGMWAPQAVCTRHKRAQTGWRLPKSPATRPGHSPAMVHRAPGQQGPQGASRSWAPLTLLAEPTLCGCSRWCPFHASRGPRPRNFPAARAGGKPRPIRPGNALRRDRWPLVDPGRRSDPSRATPPPSRTLAELTMGLADFTYKVRTDWVLMEGLGHPWAPGPRPWPCTGPSLGLLPRETRPGTLVSGD